MKKTTIWAIIVVLIVIIAGYLFYYSQTKPNSEKETIKIGAILQLSGAGSQYGDWAKKGLDLAVSEINESGGINQKLIKIIYEDSQNDPSLGISAFRKLKDTENVNMMITQGSPVALGLAPLSNQENVIQMEVGATTPKYRSENDFTFRTGMTAAQLAEAEAKIVFDKGYKKVGFLYVNDDYGLGMEQVFKNTFEKLGGQIIIEQNFLEADTDVRTQLLKIKEAKPSALIYVSRIKKSSLILNQARELGLNMQIFTDVYGIESQEVLDTAKEAANRVIYVASYFDKDLNEVSREYFSNYQQKYNNLPEQMSAQAYDAVYSLANALKDCKDLSAECFKNKLYQIEFNGATGKVTFDIGGDVTGRLTVLKTVKNGQFVKYEE